MADPLDARARFITRRTVRIDYVNHAGERAWRRILPMGLFFGTEKPWHTTPQWLLQAIDLDKDDAERTFALAGILGWISEGP